MTDITEQLRMLEKRVAFLEKLERPAIACRVYNNGNVTIGTGAQTAITFDSERWDTTGMHEAVTNPSRITFNLGGWYIIGGHAEFANHATGVRYLSIRMDGATYIGSARELSPNSLATTVLFVASLYYVSATNYAELMAYQTSGGDLTVLQNSQYSPEFWAARLP